MGAVHVERPGRWRICTEHGHQLAGAQVGHSQRIDQLAVAEPGHHGSTFRIDIVGEKGGRGHRQPAPFAEQPGPGAARAAVDQRSQGALQQRTQILRRTGARHQRRCGDHTHRQLAYRPRHQAAVAHGPQAHAHVDLLVHHVGQHFGQAQIHRQARVRQQHGCQRFGNTLAAEHTGRGHPHRARVLRQAAPVAAVEQLVHAIDGLPGALGELLAELRDAHPARAAVE